MFCVDTALWENHFDCRGLCNGWVDEVGIVVHVSFFFSTYNLRMFSENFFYHTGAWTIKGCRYDNAQWIVQDSPWAD